MLVKFKYKIQKQSLPKWTGLGGGVGGDDKDVPIWPGSPHHHQHTTIILSSSPSKAVISMEDMVGCFNEVSLSAGKRVEVENTLERLVCRRFKSTCSQRASYDWNSMSCSCLSHQSPPCAQRWLMDYTCNQHTRPACASHWEEQRSQGQAAWWPQPWNWHCIDSARRKQLHLSSPSFICQPSCFFLATGTLDGGWLAALDQFH